MRFAALFFDALDPKAVDAELTRRHFAYLRRCADRVAMAGGLRAEPEGPFCGSLWVIEAASLAEATALVEGDPYCAAGLRPDRRVFVWNRPPGSSTDRSEAP